MSKKNGPTSFLTNLVGHEQKKVENPWTRRLAESVEGLNSSLALAAGDLWPKKASQFIGSRGR